MARRSTPNAPTRIVWLIALVVGILGIVVRFVDAPALAELKPYNYWMLLSGFVLLAAGTSIKNL